MEKIVVEICWSNPCKQNRFNWNTVISLRGIILFSVTEEELWKIKDKPNAPVTEHPQPYMRSARLVFFPAYWISSSSRFNFLKFLAPNDPDANLLHDGILLE